MEATVVMKWKPLLALPKKTVLFSGLWIRAWKTALDPSLKRARTKRAPKDMVCPTAPSFGRKSEPQKQQNDAARVLLKNAARGAR
jgi:hypothetical protein